MFHGLRAGGHGRSKLGPPMANSWVESLPTTMAPAPRSFSTQTASAVARLSCRILEWPVVGRPATSMMSLMPTGTPCSGPRSRPARRFGFGRLGGLHGGLAVETDEGVELRIERGDAVEQGFHELDRREILCRDRAGGLGDAKPVQFGHGPVSHRPAPARIGGHGSARRIGRLLDLLRHVGRLLRRGRHILREFRQRLGEARAPRQQFDHCLVHRILLRREQGQHELAPAVHPLYAAHSQPLYEKAVTAGGDRRGS